MGKVLSDESLSCPQTCGRSPRRRPKGGAIRRIASLTACLATVAAWAAHPAAAYPRPGRTELASASSAGAPGGSNSFTPVVSGDGRFVAFYSEATDLVPDDTNGKWDVFVHDRLTASTERVSVASDGTQAAGGSSLAPAISGDGRYVAFLSDARNLVPGDTNLTTDAFVHDRATGSTERVSVASDGTQANNETSSVAISADGRTVAFGSLASTLVPGDTNVYGDVFAHDRGTGATRRVSVASDGAQALAGSSIGPSLSDDGRIVAFHSFATNLVPGDANATADVFVHDVSTATTERVSVASDGTEANGTSSRASISGSGRWVAFDSSAPNLVPADGNGVTEVFVHDRATGATERAAPAADGTDGDQGAFTPAISRDGRFVTFHSFATNLVAGDTNGAADVFVYDRVAARTERASVGSDGAEGSSSSSRQGISADGGVVAFSSFASNLVPGVAPGTLHIFVRDRGAPLGVGGMTISVTGGGLEASGWYTVSSVELSTASDPPGDAGPAGGEAGADLTAAAVVYRPEEGDLVVRLRVRDLPGVRGPSPGVPGAAAGAPAIVYGLALDIGSARYEVRVLRAAAAAAPPAAPLYSLHRCETVCTESARLQGAFGTTGEEVLAMVPLAALGLHEGEALGGLRAFTGLGEGAAGAVAELDEIDLPPAVVPPLSLRLTVGEEEAQGAVDRLSDGTFTASADVGGLPPGDHGVTATLCLGASCISRTGLAHLG